MHKLLNETYQALIKGEEPPINFQDIERTNRLVNALLHPENKF